jgi:hypothetical protein
VDYADQQAGDPQATGGPGHGVQGVPRKDIVNIPAKRMRCDESRVFCHAKQKNVPQGVFGYGDVWTWTASDADSKLMIPWTLELRDAGYASEFMHDAAGWVANCAKTHDGRVKCYLNAVERRGHVPAMAIVAMRWSIQDGYIAVQMTDTELILGLLKCTYMERAKAKGNEEGSHRLGRGSLCLV